MNGLTRRHAQRESALASATSRLSALVAGHSLLAVVGLAALVAVVVFWNFLFGDRLYVFPQAGVDTYSQYWPVDYHLSGFVRSGRFPSWSFGIGLGTTVSYPLLNPGLAVLYVLPAQAYLPGLAIKAIFESLAAAAAWWLYLRCLRVRGFATLIFPLLFAFNGYLTLWGQHRRFGFVCLIVPLVLCGYELLLQKQKRWPLVAALTYFLCTDFYLFWMFAVFFGPFSVLRLLSDRPWSWSTFRSWALQLGLCGGVAALLSAWSLVPTIVRLLDSPRIAFGGGSSYGSTGGYPLSVILSSALRLYSNNVLGTDSGYRGPLTYYELPTLYAGLLPLLLIPQVFVLAGRRERWILLAGSAFAGAAIGSPQLAHLFNGLCSVSHRHSFVVVVFMLYVAARAFVLLEARGCLDRRLLLATFCVLLLPLAAVLGVRLLVRYEALPFAACRTLLDAVRAAVVPHVSLERMLSRLQESVLPPMTRELLKASLLLGLYAALLGWYSARRRFVVGVLLVSLTVVELMLMTWPTHNARATLDKAVLTRREGYFDASFDAAGRLRKADPSFYRVQKTYNSVFLNDNLLQGYYGTQAYISVQEPGLLAFYHGMRVPLLQFFAAHVPGVGSRVMVSTFLGVKYVMTKGPPLPWPGYELADRVGDVAVYRNDYALPLGFAYRQWIGGPEFRRLPDVLKQLALLNAFMPTVADSAATADRFSPWSVGPREAEAAACLYSLAPGSAITPSNGHLDWMGETGVTFRAEGDAASLAFGLAGGHEGSIALSFDLASTVNTSILVSVCERGPGHRESARESLSVYAGRAHYDMDLFTDITNAFVRVRFPGGPAAFELSGLDVRRFPTALYEEAVSARRRAVLALDSFGEDRLAGTITVEEESMLGTTIPFNKGWKARRNGVAVPVSRINMGFVGIPLPKGTSRIELRFTPVGLHAGGAVALFTLAALALLTFRRRTGSTGCADSPGSEDSVRSGSIEAGRKQRACPDGP